MLKRCFIVLMTVLFAFSFFVLPNKASAASTITINSSPDSVGKYEKLEVTFTLGSGYSYTNKNPFNPNPASPGGAEPYQMSGVRVDGSFRKIGDSSWIIQPAFYDGNGNWKLRFTPKTLGNWEYKIRAEDSSGVNESAPRAFTVTDSQNHGFLQVNPNDSRFFQFEDGTAFMPIGTAISGISVDRNAAIDNMSQYGMNFSRVFLNTGTQIEVMGTDTTLASCSDLNNYNLSRAASVDAILNHAHDAGVYIEWVQEDWEKIKDRATSTQNTYVACGSTVAADVAGFFGNATAKEIYQRKLRYIAARWGYSTNLMAIELVNELGGGGSATSQWHIDMGNYYHNITPYSKHLISSSNGSEELRLGGGIPWNNAAMDFVNYHSYAKCTNPWDYAKFDTKLETLDSPEGRPWFDSATWADRIVRAYRGNSWSNKPFLWTEFGLGMSDWNVLYTADTTGRHLSDAIWASSLAGYVINHWKYDYVDGTGIYSPDKFAAFKSLSNYFEGVNFSNLKQETTYPVADSRNPNPTTVSTNPNIFAVAMKNNDKAYFYVKNTTVPWINLKLSEISACTSNTTPAPAPESGTIQVKGLAQGSYIYEKWSTVDSDKTSQILEKKALTVGSDGIASIPVSLGTIHNTSNFSDSYDFAYKLYKAAVNLQSTADKTTANVGDIVTINNRIINGKAITENGMSITNYLPYRTELVTSTPGGTIGVQPTSCSEAAIYNYPSCSGSFNLPKVTWSGINLAPQSEQSLLVTVKILPKTVILPSPILSPVPSSSPITPPPVTPSPIIQSPSPLPITPSPVPSTITPSPEISPTNPPTSDTISPIVKITTPEDGATKIGRWWIFTRKSITIKASATDNVGVTRAELYIDGILKYNFNQSSFSYKWDIRPISTGAHTIQVKAYDAAGNVGEQTITVYK